MGSGDAPCGAGAGGATGASGGGGGATARRGFPAVMVRETYRPAAPTPIAIKTQYLFHGAGVVGRAMVGGANNGDGVDGKAGDAGENGLGWIGTVAVGPDRSATEALHAFIAIAPTWPVVGEPWR